MKTTIIASILLAASTFAQADSFNGPDKPKHIAASMLSGAAVRLAFTSLNDTEAIAVAMIPGTIKEVSDATRKGGTGWSNKDMAANLLGAVIGVKLTGWAMSKQGDTVQVSYSTSF